jgi:hypothetical protein
MNLVGKRLQSWHNGASEIDPGYDRGGNDALSANVVHHQAGCL